MTLIAKNMTVGVVDALEMVNIRHQKRARYGALLGVAQYASHRKLERTSIVQLGKGIDERFALRLFELFAQAPHLGAAGTHLLLHALRRSAHAGGLAHERGNEFAQRRRIDRLLQPPLMAV